MWACECQACKIAAASYAGGPLDHFLGQILAGSSGRVLMGKHISFVKRCSCSLS